MSTTIELPDDIYRQVAAEASAAGITPAEWIAARLSNGSASPPANGAAPNAETRRASAGVVRLALPEAVYEGLEEAASASASSPEAWVAANLPSRAPRTMADLFAGRVGLVESNGDGRLSEDAEKLFGDGLEAKRRAGRL